MGHRLSAVALSVVIVALTGCNEQTSSLPDPFSREVDAAFPGAPRDPLRALGQALFFDPELSGNRNISCGTCHVPFLTTAEGIPLPLGEGATELGPFRARGSAAIVSRHTLDLFHRSEMDVLFWDGRVERLASGEVVGPVPTPAGITRALELASIVPLLDRAEMRGSPGDITVIGTPNELATIADDDPFAIWQAITDRLRRSPGYATLFSQAFPGEPIDSFGVFDVRIHHIAIALAHFQQVLWGPLEARIDFERTDEVTRGEELFMGDAGCVRCHSGPLFTDERYYDLAVPQLGPGTEGGLDQGRFDVTGAPADRFAFRTPPLRNVALTPPYMHNGSIPTLEAAIRHHLDPVASLHAYTGEHLPASLRATLRTDAALLDDIAANVADTAPLRPLSDDEIAALVAFLEALSNPAELTRHPEDALPATVPSGLPIDRWNGAPHPFR